MFCLNDLCLACCNQFEKKGVSEFIRPTVPKLFD